MYRLVILSIAVVTAVAAALDKKDCARIFHPHSMHCCKKSKDMKDKLMFDDLKECFELPKDPVACEHELCIAKKKGFATDDGKLDKKKLEEVMSADVENKELLEDLKKNCLNGDLEKYGPPDFCDFMKMRHCSTMNLLNHCENWNDFADCKDLKGLVAECVKIME